jgi:hypothetical protein
MEIWFSSVVITELYELSDLPEKISLFFVCKRSHKTLLEIPQFKFFLRIKKLKKNIHSYYDYPRNRVNLNDVINCYTYTINHKYTMSFFLFDQKKMPKRFVEIWLHYVSVPDDQILIGPDEWEKNPQVFLHWTEGHIWRAFVSWDFLKKRKLHYHLRNHKYLGVPHNRGYVITGSSGHRDSKVLKIPADIQPYSVINIPWAS